MKRLSRAALWWTDVDRAERRAEAEAGEVEGHDPAVAGELRPEPDPVEVRAAEPVHEDDGWRGTVLVAALRTAEVDVVDGPVEVDGATGATPRRSEVEGLPGSARCGDDRGPRKLLTRS